MKPKLKHRDLNYKSVMTQVADVDEKGVVKFYASIFNTPDRVKDIVVPGAYKKTIAENFSDIQHYKNHYSDEMPGVITELAEDATGLLVTSKLIMDTQIGAETYAQYKAMAEVGKSMGHSIGYVPVKEDTNGEWNYLKEIFLFEVSTLTKRPAHPSAVTVDLKTEDEMLTEIEYIEALLKSDLPDVELEELEKIKSHIEALILSRREATQQKDEPLTRQEILKILLRNG
jgi:HK97 family phage prohead protease